jgi:hypothetical protein
MAVIKPVEGNEPLLGAFWHQPWIVGSRKKALADLKDFRVCFLKISRNRGAILFK